MLLIFTGTGVQKEGRLKTGILKVDYLIKRGFKTDPQG